MPDLGNHVLGGIFCISIVGDIEDPDGGGRSGLPWAVLVLRPWWRDGMGVMRCGTLPSTIVFPDMGILYQYNDSMYPHELSPHHVLPHGCSAELFIVLAL